jgi:hypothetical protein
LADASLEPRGATWGGDGTILFSPGTLTPIYRVSAAGGAASPLTQLDQSRDETSHRWPYLLPDGRHFIYFARGTKKENQALFVGSMDSRDRKLLLNVESSVAYRFQPAAEINRNGGRMGKNFSTSARTEESWQS